MIQEEVEAGEDEHGSGVFDSPTHTSLDGFKDISDYWEAS